MSLRRTKCVLWPTSTGWESNVHEHIQRIQRLPLGEVESIYVATNFVAGRGWDLSLGVRRQFEAWAEARRWSYELLSTPEMLCTLDADLASTLKL